MVLHERQYSSRCVEIFHLIGWWSIFPCYWFLNQFLSLFNRTSDEQLRHEEDPCYQRLVILTFVIPILLALFLASVPFAIIGLLIWIPLNQVRKPYIYSCQLNQSCDLVCNITDNSEWLRKLTVVSSNVCLLPEAIARFNNLSNTQSRAREIGHRIISCSRTRYKSLDNETAVLSDTSCNSDKFSIDVIATECEQENSASNSCVINITSTPSLSTHITTTFHDIDFLCLQEVFDQRAGSTLASILHDHFPYVLHDVGVYTWRSNYFVLNSGLFFASRYPIVDADYECFEHCRYEDSLAAKGLLLIKVLIGYQEINGCRKSLVGYIANTHLQNEQGTHDIRACQLSDIHDWLHEFKEATANFDDVVVFDILCGDFNFDNVSTSAENHWGHKLMRLYSDPCRVAPGEDQNWTMGTVLFQHMMHKKSARTPENLKSTLEDISKRINCFESTHKEDNLQKDGRRRVDYILYRADIEGQMDINNYSFITALAPLTDHIPVSMSFTPCLRRKHHK